MILMSDDRIVPLRDNVNYRRQKRKKQAKSKRKQTDVSAGDFETIDGNAWLFTIAWYESQVNAKGNALHRKPKVMKSAIEEYTSENPFTFKRFVDFIFDNMGIIWRRGGKNQVKGLRCPYLYFYNLKYDGQTIIKELSSRPEIIDKIMLMQKVVIDVNSLEEVAVIRDKWGNPRLTKGQDRLDLLQISYLPKKHLRMKPLGRLSRCVDSKGVERIRGAIDCFDIAQFYGKSLANASKDAMKDGLITQTKLDTVDTKRMNDPQYREDNYDEILEYALIDSKVTLELTWIKVQELENNGFRMVNPYSPASVSERSLLDLCDMPSMDAMWKNHQERILSFWTAFTGGWFSAMGSGMKRGVRCYDIASAYPATM